jgi:hypothetical protein
MTNSTHLLDLWIVRGHARVACVAKSGSWTAAQCAWTLAMTLHITRYAQPGKSSVGEQHGQENLEEIEEDQPDQAVDESNRVQVRGVFGVAPACRGAVRAIGPDYDDERAAAARLVALLLAGAPADLFQVAWHAVFPRAVTIQHRASRKRGGSPVLPLKISTRGDYFNARSAGSAKTS